MIKPTRRYQLKIAKMLRQGKSSFYTMISLFIIYGCNNPSAKPVAQKPNTITIDGKKITDTVLLSFHIPRHTIYNDQSGKVERIVEKKFVSKNELLVQFDNYDEFVNLSGEKETYKDDLSTAINQLPKELTNLKQKWEEFEKAITPDKLLPPFPTVQFREESDWVLRRKLSEKYNKLLTVEKKIRNYFITAPFEGNILKTYVKQGDFIEKNTKIALIQAAKGEVCFVSKSNFEGISKNALYQSLSKQLKTELIAWEKQRKDTICMKFRSLAPITKTPKKILLQKTDYAFEIPSEFISKNNMVVYEVNGIKQNHKIVTIDGNSYLYCSEKQITLIR